MYPTPGLWPGAKGGFVVSDSPSGSLYTPPLPPHRRTSPTLAGLLLLGVVGALFLAAGLTFLATRKQIVLQIDGHLQTVYTRRATVGDVLDELGVLIMPQDAVNPAEDTGLSNGAVIRIQRAQPVIVVADGRALRLMTHQDAPLNLLAEAGIALNPGDEVLVDGAPLVNGVPLTDPAQPLAGSIPAVVEVVRSVRVIVEADGQEIAVQTTEPTVGRVLDSLGMTLYLADSIEPDVHTPPAEGTRVTVRRAVPVIVTVGGVEVATRTRADTVGATLAGVGLALVGEDYSVPPPEDPLPSDGRIRVVRVAEDVQVERVEIPYETIFQPDAALELDARRVVQPGVPGIAERCTRIRTEDGREVSRAEEAVRVEQPPVDEIVAYGTRVAIRTLQTPGGRRDYWRVIRMRMDGYTPSSSGRAGSDTVIVDPALIPPGIRIYVPGYGEAVTASAAAGRRPSLLADADDPAAGARVDVYLLTPAPAPEDIPYLLP